MSHHVRSVLKLTRQQTGKSAGRRAASAAQGGPAEPTPVARVRDGLVLRAVRKPSDARSQPDERGAC